MLRLVNVYGEPTGIYAVDPTIQFQPGMIGGLSQIGGSIVLTVSDGTTIQPMGLIDDVRTQAYTDTVADEDVIIPAVPDAEGKSIADVQGLLMHANIVEKSFVADHDTVLYPTNGAICVPAGTLLNYDRDEDGILDSIKVRCSYMWRITDLPGDDTTLATGLMTVWIQRGIYATDQYDTTVAYPLNGLLYCGTDGKFTTAQNGSQLAIITGPPTASNSLLEFLWF